MLSGKFIRQLQMTATQFQCSLICEEETELFTPRDSKLLDALQVYFDPALDGPLKDCSFDELHGFAAKVYDRYMCSAAADDALGHTERDTNVYGEPWSGEVVDNEPEIVPGEYSMH